jgi:Calpain family cysteine protease
MSERAPQYTNQDLYGTNGEPQLVDIRQDKLYNCYLVSSMGALAEQQPDRICDAIRFEPDPNNPNTGVFHVALHHPTRGRVEVPVTQADVEYNIQREGGGTADNRKGSPLWPTVMEAAFAKLHDPNPNNVDKKDAYDVIADPRRGGNLHEAMFALTGDKGHNLRYDQSPKGHSGPPGSASTKDEQRPSFNMKLYEKNVTRFDDANSAYTKINEALGSANPVTLSTRNANVNDGIAPHHAFIVTGIEQREKKDGSNETFITMRNPYANNNNKPEESKDTSKPSITVSLDKMLRDDVFGEINIGPARRVQTQQQSTPSPTPEQATPLQATPPQPAPSQTAPTQNKNEAPNTSAQLGHPSNSAHPFHSVFNQATAHVNKEDEKLGRNPDEKSERLSMSATALAAENGITRIDHMTFNVENKERGLKAGENLIIVQGGFNDPAHERANMKTEVAINTPVEQSIKQLDVIQQRQTQEAQTLALQQTQDPTKIRGPSIG